MDPLSYTLAGWLGSLVPKLLEDETEDGEIVEPE